jgi:thiol:disulfide interchange protein DsbD
VGVDAAGATQVVDASQGLMRSVGEGVLAVLLATPCSAPFLGTAVGFALASPGPVVLAVFATLGVGLAAPFVALVMVPGIARALPRPGPWMMHARQLLGFFLLATVVWLLWVLGQLAGVGGMTSALAFLVCVGLAAWLWGVVQHGGVRGRVVGALASSVLLLGVGISTLPRRALPPGQLATPRPGNWLPYDEAAIADTLASGKPVFVDFTADWCLTCKANERMVIARDTVQQAFADHQVVLFKADWTRRDEHIRRVLARHGKAGVPMYLLFSPSRPAQPSVLPEVLTVDGLVADVAAAGRGEGGR